MKPVLYQLFVRLFGNKTPNPVYSGSIAENGCGKFADISDTALHSIKSLGVTHIWFTGVIAHACTTDYSRYGIRRSCAGITKGKAGSPYAIRDYYDCDPDLAVDIPSRMKEFQALVKRTHKAGMKVLIDFVGNHVARQYQGDQRPAGVDDLGENDQPQLAFHPNNDFYYLPGQAFRIPELSEPWGDKAAFDIDLACYEEFPARATGNDCFSAQPSVHDWYETIKLNYGVDFQNGMKLYPDPRPPLWDKMKDILLYWAGQGVDGFRCDMAGMVPVEFWSYAMGEIRRKYPEILFIAEIYEPHRYHDFLRAGFNYLYDKEGMYNALFDVLRWGHPASRLSEVWKNLEGLEIRMLRFIENHDEVRLASFAFAGDAMAGIPAMIAAAAMHSGPVMIYNGQETGEYAEGSQGFSGEDGRTSIFDYTTMPCFQKWMGDGSFSGDQLEDWQRRLMDFYRGVLPGLYQAPAVKSGAFYDLMWVNQQPPCPDPGKVFSWLRYGEAQILLFILNFSREPLPAFRLFIPVHAFDTMQLNSNDTFLLRGFGDAKEYLRFTGYMAAYEGLEMQMQALGYGIYEIQRV